MMRKMILILLLLCFSSVGSAEEYKGEVVDIRSVNKTVLSGELYITDADGKYEGYKKLNGYPGQDKFQVYFKQGEVFADILNIDMDERIEWEYKGATWNNSRREIYGLFADLRHSGSRAVHDTWEYKTFGQVYLDWLQRITITDDALRLVTAQALFARGEKPYDRFSTAKIKLQ